MSLFYSSETWTEYVKLEKKLERFHPNTYGVTSVSHKEKYVALKQVDTWSKHHFLRRHLLRCLVYVHLMNVDRLLKDIMYGELIMGRNPAVRPTLRFKDVCKRYLKLMGIIYSSWEQLCRQSLAAGAEMLKRESGRAGCKTKIICWRSENNAGSYERNLGNFIPYSTFACRRECHAKIGQLSHSRQCLQKT